MFGSKRLPPAALLIIACALWGGATVLNKALLGFTPPLALLTLQLAPSAVVLWASVLLSGVRVPATSLLIPLVLLGIFNPGISYTLSLVGLDRSSASVSVLLWAAEPLMILGLAALILREPVSWRLILVMMLGMFGVGLVADIWS